MGGGGGGGGSSDCRRMLVCYPAHALIILGYSQTSLLLWQDVGNNDSPALRQQSVFDCWTFYKTYSLSRLCCICATHKGLGMP